jgi:hypothetical protein
VTETVEQEGEDAARTVTELLERLGKDLGQLVVSEAQLEAARNMPEIKRAARVGVGSTVAAAAVTAAFVFLNVAAYAGLLTVWSAWVAALVLAGAWIAVGGVLAAVLFSRVRGWRLWRVFAASPAEAIEDLEKARDQAGDAVRDTLTELGPAISIEIATAAIPAAGSLAEGMMDASEEVVEAIAENLPAGSTVNQMWDVALMPGRLGLRVATTVLRREPGEKGSKDTGK